MQAAAEEDPDARAYLNSQRESLIKRMAIVIILDCCILAGIISIMIPNSPKTKECFTGLYWAGSAVCIYHIFFVLRNMIICSTTYYSKNPVRDSTVSRLGFVCLDCCAYTAVVIWATIQLFEEESTVCRDELSEVENFWWMLCVLIVFGYIQIFVEWLICLVASCVFVFFCCFYFSVQQSERANALARFTQHAPLMSRALGSLQTEKFSNLSAKSKEV